MRYQTELAFTVPAYVILLLSAVLLYYQLIPIDTSPAHIAAYLPLSPSLSDSCPDPPDGLPLKVFVGTWNIGASSEEITDGLELLIEKIPAGTALLIFGFQEVADLAASSVYSGFAREAAAELLRTLRASLPGWTPILTSDREVPTLGGLASIALARAGLGVSEVWYMSVPLGHSWLNDFTWGFVEGLNIKGLPCYSNPVN